VVGMADLAKLNATLGDPDAASVDRAAAAAELRTLALRSPHVDTLLHCCAAPLVALLRDEAAGEEPPSDDRRGRCARAQQSAHLPDTAAVWEPCSTTTLPLPASESRSPHTLMSQHQLHRTVSDTNS
jgi:hypothetical protein